MITVVNPFAPGGFTDGIGRAVLQHVSRALGQPFVLDYRPGAGATVGALSIIRAAADGYTLLYSPTTAWVVSPWLRGNAYDPTTAFTPVAEIAQTPMVLAARAGFAAAGRVAALVEEAKRRPGKITYASAGSGSLPHLMGTYFASLAGIALNHVPYRGGAPAMNDLLAGHVDLMFEAIPNVAQHVEARRAVPLMISGGARSPLLLDTPTVQEVGFPDLDLTSWIGLGGPAGLPPAIVAALNLQVNAALAAEDARTAMARLSMVPLGGPPERMAARIARESALYRRIVESAGITAE